MTFATGSHMLQVKKFLYRNNIEISIVVLALCLSIIKIRFTQSEDQGIWLSVFGFLSSGERLYSEVYDNKDPLFFLFGTLLYNVFGLYGPFFQDVLAIVAIPVFAYRICLQLKLPISVSFLSTIFLVFALTGSHYDGFRSLLMSMVFVFGSLYFAFKTRPLGCGVLTIAAAGFKFPFIAFCFPAFLVLLLNSQNIKSTVVKYTMGAAAGAVLLLGSLIAVGSVPAYVDVLLENFVYSTNYLEMLGRKGGLSGHLELVDQLSTGNYALVAVFVFSLISIALYRNSLLRRQLLPLLLLSAISLIYLISTAMWPHHMYVLVMFAWALAIISFYNLFILISPKEVTKEPSNSVFFNATLVLANLAISILLCAIANINLKYDVRQQYLNISKFKWDSPPEVAALNSLYLTYKGRPYIARLGANDDVAIGAFINDKFKLACPRFAQFGNESELAFDEMINCLENKPDYIVIAPFFHSLKRIGGHFDKFRGNAKEILASKFTCSAIPVRDGASVCVRKTLTMPR